MVESGSGAGAAGDAGAAVSTDQGTPQIRPAGIPANYVWDKTLGPIEDATGLPRGAWTEPPEATAAIEKALADAAASAAAADAADEAAVAAAKEADAARDAAEAAAASPAVEPTAVEPTTATGETI
jgi:hypothetical protein